ncbi:pre-mRNA-splicing regulator WTAP isoform X1 [Centrocercus urophasianus]|uniref:pre-mRNA-splicing regulator WTAP isoform X1 n=1 Tax=Phasianus colchicus TaxID=9054 RepID=UPI00129E5B0B|nr:pre-mRNA-splicing regulator WTAP isoform X1 [Phasianus colchicus]XP_031468328.1 pre-mRNA-splicing regulator WTAP isoform X1 [Phasianus colchicus]XP_042670713.1 pre-mRNA-splicing regulator WTAP isoform X1 [Centrocercus urophasianus]XP_042738462.1 pre-mRNA-splicing regulator WTAP isoform X1 [Lagopus leucura]XP_048791119.1 pre-mRNA-splicing regulator WTAP isoform X1 [Lagopus muta]XP_052531724.1 pre-mRNA-splicing regulator WTAP isoform X1 [Tympanuchus pallidicinctus]
MTNEEPLPKKVRLSEADFKVLPRDELILRWKQYEAYVQALEGKYTDLNSNDVTGLRESEEKLKQQQQESARRENILVMRLATKEQEMQECTWASMRRAWLRLLYSPHQNQIQYLKQVQQPSVAQLRSTMVDPAINLFFLKMKGELEQTKDKLEQAQNELSAWKFTPDSQTGKKLMAKCRMLIQENQELGRQLSQGRIAQLEAELALQKKYSEELKSSQDELNDFIIQLDEEVEGMQSTILVLQQQLKETRQQLAQYQQQQSQVSNPGTSRTPSSEPTDQGEAVGKDCSRLANGPSNGSSSHQRTSGPGFYREGSSTEDDFPASPGNGNKLSNHSEDRTGRGGGSYINQLSTGYESVDSPTGSENSLTHHSNDTDSNHDPQEEKTVSMKGNRTAGSRHVQNGLDSNVNVQGSVL